MDEKSNKTLSIVLGVSFLVFILYAIINYLIIEHKFDNPEIEKKFSIGVISNFEAGAKTSSTFTYEFYVNSQKHKSFHDIDSKLGLKSSEELKKYIGKKYKVWYVAENPEYSKLLIDKPVNDTVPIYRR